MRNSAKPQIDIVIRESKSSASAGLLPSFSALDKVCGEVSVSPPSPVFIRTLYVTLVGELPFQYLTFYCCFILTPGLGRYGQDLR